MSVLAGQTKPAMAARNHFPLGPRAANHAAARLMAPFLAKTKWPPFAILR
jgi:hypothetical protein